MAVLGVTAVAFALIALPAQAKVPGEDQGIQAESVAVTGPGVDSPISLNGEAAAFWGLSTHTFTFGKLQSRPTGPLGPGYQALYTLSCGDGSMAIVHQTLYPFHRLAAWVYTPAGQAGCGGLLPVAGWSGAGSALVKSLQEQGLPTVAPRVPAAPPLDLPGPNPLPIALLIAALLVLVGLGVAAGRPRKPVTSAVRA